MIDTARQSDEEKMELQRTVRHALQLFRVGPQVHCMDSGFESEVEVLFEE